MKSRLHVRVMAGDEKGGGRIKSCGEVVDGLRRGDMECRLGRRSGCEDGDHHGIATTIVMFADHPIKEPNPFAQNC
ncbi:hypothetical protein C1H46_000412 [Malus baccata]|uniref:Uncharacterized protein n=1 Tax=Malus baccata TaxID=106549 RepID=A0A540NTU5_MALBA|nr:hypothetical protein C1H46_000412 [Malus baccata]